jgi:hypothetical protein
MKPVTLRMGLNFVIDKACAIHLEEWLYLVTIVLYS